MRAGGRSLELSPPRLCASAGLAAAGIRTRAAGRLPERAMGLWVLAVLLVASRTTGAAALVSPALRAFSSLHSAPRSTASSPGAREFSVHYLQQKVGRGGGMARAS